MESVSYAAGSAILTRQIVEELKKKYGVKGLYLLGLSFIINLVLAIGWAYFDGAPLTSAFVRGVVQTIGSTIYHDLKTA